MHEIYEKSLVIRAVENQLLEGYKRRHFGGTVDTCIGQEVTPSILSEVLSNNPFIISNHRGYGHFVAHTNLVENLFCEFLGKKGTQSKGIGGSQNTLLGSGVMLSGSVSIGKNVVLGAGVSVESNITIQDNVYVCPGLGVSQHLKEGERLLK